MLSRHEPEPGGEVATAAERFSSMDLKTHVGISMPAGGGYIIKAVQTHNLPRERAGLIWTRMFIAYTRASEYRHLYNAVPIFNGQGRKIGDADVACII